MISGGTAEDKLMFIYHLLKFSHFKSLVSQMGMKWKYFSKCLVSDPMSVRKAKKLQIDQTFNTDLIKIGLIFKCAAKMQISLLP